MLRWVSDGDGGIQIADVTDPANPKAVGQLADNSTLLLSNSYLDIFNMSGNTYAAAASFDDDGIQIVSLADPANPMAVGQLADNSTLLLADARGVDVFEMGGSAYAAVSSYREHGIQIVSLADPTNPAAAGKLRDGSTMERTRGVAVFEASGSYYAAVASREDGFNLVNITDPASPAPAGHLGTATLQFSNANGIAVLEIDSEIYAVLTSGDDDGILTINITNPDSPSVEGRLSDGGSLLLDGAARMDIF